MIFNTSWFILFFAVVIGLLCVLPGRKVRFYFLLAASAVFHYHFAGPAGVLPIIVMATVVYGIALRLESSTGAARKRWIRAGIAVPLVGLIWYKYRVLLVGTLFAFLPAVKAPLLALVPGLALPRPMPLAISFFTFEFVHYLVEVYHGHKALRRPDHFALFCIYFPSIVSGPIKRYTDFVPQFTGGLARPALERSLEGLAQVVLGFFKKMVVADNANVLLGLMEARQVWRPWHVVVLIVLLSVRILFDFSGYSDIAIGLSKIIGLDLPANFNFPYLASNIQDFWRRWHMSLSNWIRDYIYIPLGGSRQGAGRKMFNALAAMALCGLWHGAAWHFMIWGIYHGLGMTLHTVYRKCFPGWGLGSRLYLFFAHALTLAFVGYGWLFFFFPLSQVWGYSRCLVGLHG